MRFIIAPEEWRVPFHLLLSCNDKSNYFSRGKSDLVPLRLSSPFKPFTAPFKLLEAPCSSSPPSWLRQILESKGQQLRSFDKHKGSSPLVLTLWLSKPCNSEQFWNLKDTNYAILFQMNPPPKFWRFWFSKPWYLEQFWNQKDNSCAVLIVKKGPFP